MENTHNGEKRRKPEHIAINNGPPWKKIVDPFFIYQEGWNKSKKTTVFRIRIHKLEAWIRGSGSGSTPKCHGSGTLQKTISRYCPLKPVFMAAVCIRPFRFHTVSDITVWKNSKYPIRFMRSGALWTLEGSLYFPGQELPRAYLVDTSEEALLIPDWLKLKMIRSSVSVLVDSALRYQIILSWWFSPTLLIILMRIQIGPTFFVRCK